MVMEWENGQMIPRLLAQEVVFLDWHANHDWNANGDVACQIHAEQYCMLLKGYQGTDSVGPKLP